MEGGGATLFKRVPIMGLECASILPIWDDSVAFGGPKIKG